MFYDIQNNFKSLAYSVHWSAAKGKWSWWALEGLQGKSVTTTGIKSLCAPYMLIKSLC